MVSLTEIVEKFAAGKSLNTRKTYKSLARSLQNFLIENRLSLENATSYHFKTWITGFRTANSKASAKRFLSALLKFLGYYEQLYSLKALLREVKPDFSKFRVDLTTEEINKLIEACYPTHYKLAVSLMAYNGLRVGEVLSLFWEDIDVERDRITLLRRKGERYYPKGMSVNDKPVHIPLNPISKRFYLQLYSERQNHVGRILPISYKTFLKWFYRYTEGVLNKPYRITPHKLRHAFAHLWLENNGSVRRLQAMLRHKNITTTQVYSEPSIRELKREFQLVLVKTLKSQENPAI
jgi:integrase